ncbi:pyrin-like [Embiotoca jacksoni]|uniref:pyrin-like n=1 Tax=Embiotoca jacksoni TaxID=100190 RepID=UPI00370408A7
MTTPKEDLWNVLEELTDAEFKHFKWFLKENDVGNGVSGIAAARLEPADRQDVVDLMMAKYGRHHALEITTQILKKISRNDLAEHLSNIAVRWRGATADDAAPLRFEFGTTKAKLKMMISQRQMKIWEIQRSADLSRKSADALTADGRRVFGDLLRSVESGLASLIEEIEEKAKRTQDEAEGFVREMRQEISDLTARSAEVERLSPTENRQDFVRSCSLLKALLPAKDWTGVAVPPPSYGESTTAAVNRLKEKLCRETERFLSRSELCGVRLAAADVTLDPDTAHRNLVLSDDGRRVHCGDVQPNLADRPERFNSAINVLGKQSFSSGRFYFEVEVDGKTAWDLGVVKESIARKGSIKASPENGYWTICLRSGDKYKASAVRLCVKRPPKKVGVFVDYEKGSVSFYGVDSAELVHRFTNCSFAEKLFPFFSPGIHHNGLNSAPLIISPVDYKD